jgi:tetratricopeptide (TPR) repeat protein
MPADPAEFLEVARPSLEDGDAAQLASDLMARWTLRDLCGLMTHASVDVRRVASVALGLVGNASNQGCLARALHDEDEQVREMAEHALWSIWFRSGRPEANDAFQEGLDALGREEYADAVEHFEAAVERDPQFAEAHNQLAICHSLRGEHQQSLRASQRALCLVPVHFGAMAGLGHGYAHLGRLNEALDCYRQAVQINPRLTEIARAVHQLEKKLGRPKHDVPGSARRW